MPNLVQGAYNATPPTLADGQTGAMQLDSSGNLKIAGAVTAPTGASATQVQGNVASAATDSGNPLKVGGVYSAGSQPTLTIGQRGDIQLDINGSQVGTSRTTGSTLADGFSNASVPLPTGITSSGGAAVVSNRVLQMMFNGTSWDRERGNMDGTAFASAARTATPTPFDAVNYNARGLHLVIDVTAVAATPSVVFTLQGQDVVSGKFYTILASAAITGTGTTVLRVYPGLTAAANLVASDILPRTWRVIATHGDADSITYSVGYSLIL